MKKLFIALMAMLAVNTAAWADEEQKEPVTGLVVTLTEASEIPAKKILFTSSPVLTHSQDLTQITITSGTEEFEPIILNVADIENITFANVTHDIVAIESVLTNNAENAIQGIYDLNGIRVSDVKAGKTYIVNGQRVMIK